MDTLPGATVALPGRNYCDAEFMDTAGPSLKLIAKPGIGVEFNEEAAAAFPYQQAYLPYNRLIDGTVHDW